MMKLVSTLLVLLTLAGCAATQSAHTLSDVGEMRPGFLNGYLAIDEIPDSKALVPPAPAANSALEVADQAANIEYQKLRDSDRWELAGKDAELKFPAAADTFSCALDLPITEQDTPFLYRVLRRSLTDAGLSTYGAKMHYQRKRPFAVNGQPTCAPEDEEHLRSNGSYPSGHTSIGWAWALLLAELSPERKDAILQRGWEFGESREICNVHWNSDTEMGRVMGAAAVAAIHGNAEFQADFKEAAAEVKRLREQGARSPLDCALEQTVLQKEEATQ